MAQSGSVLGDVLDQRETETRARSNTQISVGTVDLSLPNEPQNQPGPTSRYSGEGSEQPDPPSIQAPLPIDGSADTTPRQPFDDQRLSTATSQFGEARSTYSRPSFISINNSSQYRSSAVGSFDLVHFLLPSFPTTVSALESTTILSTTVMRRIPITSFGSVGTEKRSLNFRPTTPGSAAKGKSFWQTHQLVLTSFRINDATPLPSPNPLTPLTSTTNSSDLRRNSDSQTIAHLHLFAVPAPPQKSGNSRPGSPANMPFPSSSMSKRRPGTADSVVTNKVEVDRQVIGEGTVVGVWESTDAADGGRKWVLRVKFERREEEWLCDMPNG